MILRALKVKDVDPESESDEEFPGVSASYPLSTLANLGLRKYLQEHYDPRTFDAKHRSAVMKSAFFSASFILTFLSALAYFHGPLAIVTYWLIPLILYKDVMVRYIAVALFVVLLFFVFLLFVIFGFACLLVTTAH